MGAIVPITLTDGESTPVDHIMEPEGASPAIWRETGDGTVPLIGQSTLQCSVKKNGNGVNRVKITVTNPVLEVPEGGVPAGYVAPPRQAFFDTCNVEFLSHSRSTLQLRKNLRMMVLDALAETLLVEAVDELKAPY